MRKTDAREPIVRGRLMMAPARWALFLTGVISLMSLLLLAGCGRTSAGSRAVTPSPTETILATASSTALPTATVTPMRVSTGGVCQPDTYGIYADQVSFETNLGEAPLPAPPKTKHGIGSGGSNAGITQAGESGVCTIGAFTSVSTFYTQRLPSLGWQYSAPPTALDACFHGTVPAPVWWKGSATFAWYDGGDAGDGSVFWSYTYCVLQS